MVEKLELKETGNRIGNRTTTTKRKKRERRRSEWSRTRNIAALRSGANVGEQESRVNFGFPRKGIPATVVIAVTDQPACQVLRLIPKRIIEGPLRLENGPSAILTHALCMSSKVSLLRFSLCTSRKVFFCLTLAVFTAFRPIWCVCATRILKLNLTFSDCELWNVHTRGCDFPVAWRAPLGFPVAWRAPLDFPVAWGVPLHSFGSRTVTANPTGFWSRLDSDLTIAGAKQLWLEAGNKRHWECS
uniref:uncharacterized protein n=1 Tax=Myxine glutinosa TaxID=7769 RepID=UPI00358FAB4F